MTARHFKIMESGTKLGHYEISTLLGKGGMGEVWRARDTKLGREVAIKTLPEEFAASSDRRARFEREAKMLAALNHPNIASIYGLEESEDGSYIVLELVEGETLAERLDRSGPFPVDEVLRVGLQIAEALESAPRKGDCAQGHQARQHQAHPRGSHQGAGFRSGEERIGWGEPRIFATGDAQCGYRGRPDFGHTRLHEP